MPSLTSWMTQHAFPACIPSLAPVSHWHLCTRVAPVMLLRCCMQYVPIELLKVPAEQTVQVVAPAKRTFIVVHHRLAGHQYECTLFNFPFRDFSNSTFDSCLILDAITWNNMPQAVHIIGKALIQNKRFQVLHDSRTSRAVVGTGAATSTCSGTCDPNVLIQTLMIYHRQKSSTHFVNHSMATDSSLRNTPIPSTTTKHGQFLLHW